MKPIFKQFILGIIILLFTNSAHAQMAMDFNRTDCNGTMRHLFEDLDSGKAVVLFFYMPNCGACPPFAKKVQTMVQNSLKTYPGKIVAYCFPYSDAQSKAQVNSWKSTNALTSFIPMDSGVMASDNYGTFGMPSVVLLGRKNHSVPFFSNSFTTTDTMTMRDSISAMLKSAPTTSSIQEISKLANDLMIYPNPSSSSASINFELKTSANVSIKILNVKGEVISTICENKNEIGLVSKQINTSVLPNGNYFVSVQVDGKSVNKPLYVVHQ